MELKKALQRVMAILPTTKDKSYFSKVRFFSDPSCVFTTDGLNSSFVFVDGSLPDLICDASLVKKAIKGKGDIVIRQDGIGQVMLFTETNSYTLAHESIEFPIPVIPTKGIDFVECDLSKLDIVKYAAPKNSKNNNFPYINFNAGFVEATNRECLMRLEGDYPISTALPIELFNKWTKKAKVSGILFNEYFVYFKFDDEYRYTTINKVNYPNTSVIYEASFKDRCAVDRSSLLDTISQATEVSEVKGVSLKFGSSLEVKALGREHVMDSYSGEVSIEGNSKEVELFINGKLLCGLLKKLKGELITLNYSEFPNPLNVISQNVKAFIWPMMIGE